MRPWEQLLKNFFIFLFRQTLQRGLRGVWLSGEWPQAPVILASNHHSWWDSYLLPILCVQKKQSFGVVVSQDRMHEFSFFGRMGALSASRPRVALALLKRGELLLIFPEGRLSPPREVAPLDRGVVWLAQKAKVKVVPVATRVVLRGHEFPEAYIVFGQPIEPDLELLGVSLNQMLSELDAQIRNAPAEEALAGFDLEITGRKSTHQRMAFWSSMLKKIIGKG